jgi:glycosyltransferase involved in cell wall biosynthesis
MRVAVVNLTSGGLSGGYRKYLTRLMPLIAGDRRVTSLTVFVPIGADPGLDTALDVRTWPGQDARLGFAGVARDVALLQPDVVFVPTARHARFGSLPVVTMVRNMEPLTVPFGGNTWAEGLKNIARASEARRASRRAHRVIAVSQHVHDFIVTRWRVERDRVGIVYHGVDRPEPDGVPEPTPPATLFTAGSIRPARGLEDALRALALVDPEVRLMVAGQVDAGCEAYAAGLRRLAHDLGVDERVKWVGQLGAAAMGRAFRACTAFVMTSRAEACPNTALEAMSYGCATVSVDRAPMPEFFGNAAMYYPPGGTQELSRHIRGLIADPAERERLGTAAARRSLAFTWEHTRDRTIEELARVLS